MTKKTKSETYYEVIVYGPDYDKLKFRLNLIFWFFVALIMSGAALAGFDGVSYIFPSLMMIFGFIGLIFYLFYSGNKKHDFYMKHGWDGYSYPLQIRPEYSSRLDD